MKQTLNGVARRPDESARMEPEASDDTACRRPELALARRYAGTLARLARRVEFTVHPIATGGLRFRRDGRDMGIHADGTVPYPAPGGKRLLWASGRPGRLTVIAAALREVAAKPESDDRGRAWATT